MVRCTSPKARPAGSRASIRSPERSRRSPAVCRKRSRPSASVGAIDVAFIGETAYVLVTLVSPDVGGSNVDGIYRVEGPDSFTVVADIGEFNLLNPPTIPFPISVHTGLQYALQPYRGGFLVTDGHLNRVLRVRRDGEISRADCVRRHRPDWAWRCRATRCTWPRPALFPTCRRTARLLSSRHAGRSRPPPQRWPPAPAFSSTWHLAAVAVSTLSHRAPGCRGAPPGSPAQPNTGALVKVNRNGTFTVITDHLDRPTSFEFIGTTAYVVTLTGEIWKIEGVSR